MARAGAACRLPSNASTCRVRPEIKGQHVELGPAQPRLASFDLFAPRPQERVGGQRYAHGQRDTHDERKAPHELVAPVVVVAAQGHVDEHVLVNTALAIVELDACEGLGDDHARGRQREEDEEEHEFHFDAVPHAPTVEHFREPADEDGDDHHGQEQRGGEELRLVVEPACHT
eukprot:CAMPEP_0182528718 /NCGR_PEP_ID=MMETSP1323-20130603/4691_1 /TAXON_ID=236787 /ORGANISM="Florenciella parvula, Strain RCC1693" /LENGTH=172 /DNA_ID=CAMNT_0024737863 /DNA_START=117 /DNA_END=632 /DNA_ORIENTATION=-